MNGGGGVDLVGAWYELGRSLVTGRPVDAASGWPLLTTREAFELARSWALVLARLGDAVEPVAWRWLDESRALLAESVGPDELLPSSVLLWEVGAALVGAPRNVGAGKPWDAIAVNIDAAGGLHVANVDDPQWLEVALRKFFAGRGRAEKQAPTGRYVEVSIGEATQLIALWDQYVAKVSTKRLEAFTADPIDPWRAWSARVAGLIAGKPPGELFPAEEAPELWRQQAKLAIGISVILGNQPLRGWSGFVAAAKAVTGAWLDDAAGAAGAVGEGAKGAAVAVGGAAKDAAGAVARGANNLLKPIAIGLGVVGALGVGALVLRK